MQTSQLPLSSNISRCARCLTDAWSQAGHPESFKSKTRLIVFVWLHQDGQEEIKLWVKAQRQPNMELPSKARDADDKESSSQVFSISPRARQTQLSAAAWDFGR